MWTRSGMGILQLYAIVNMGSTSRKDFLHQWAKLLWPSPPACFLGTSALRVASQLRLITSGDLFVDGIRRSCRALWSPTMLGLEGVDQLLFPEAIVSPQFLESMAGKVAAMRIWGSAVQDLIRRICECPRWALPLAMMMIMNIIVVVLVVVLVVFVVAVFVFVVVVVVVAVAVIVVIIAVINTMMVTYGDVGTVMIDQKLWGYHGDITLGFMKLPWKIWTARIPIRWHHAGSCRPGPFQDTSPPGTAHVSKNSVYLYIAFPAKTDHARVCLKIFGKTKNPMVRKTPFSKRPLWARSSEKNRTHIQSVDHVSTFWTFYQSFAMANIGPSSKLSENCQMNGRRFDRNWWSSP